MPTKVKAAELKLGDVVTQHAPVLMVEYDFATVTKIDFAQELVTLTRPYIMPSDYSHSAGKDALAVTPYIGVETFTMWFTSEVFRWRDGLVK